MVLDCAASQLYASAIVSSSWARTEFVLFRFLCPLPVTCKADTC